MARKIYPCQKLGKLIYAVGHKCIPQILFVYINNNGAISGEKSLSVNFVGPGTTSLSKVFRNKILQIELTLEKSLERFLYKTNPLFAIVLYQPFLLQSSSSPKKMYYYKANQLLGGRGVPGGIPYGEIHFFQFIISDSLLHERLRAINATREGIIRYVACGA